MLDPPLYPTFWPDASGRRSSSDRAQNVVVPACAIDRAAQVISALRHAVIGVAKDRLSNTDMLRVVDRQLRGGKLAQEKSATELALGSAADEVPDPKRDGRFTAGADPERIAGDRRRRAGNKKRAIMLDIAVKEFREAG